MVLHLSLVILIISATLLASESEARIRMRKIKDTPKTCTVMKEDPLLSRPAKPVWSTERHSVVISNQVTLVNDLGVKVCSWNKDLFTEVADVNTFRFYIDEYKEVIYPHVDQKERGFVMFQAEFKDCVLGKKPTTVRAEFPVCKKPKKKKKTSKKRTNKVIKKKKATTK